jgi:hypothetical protein
MKLKKSSANIIRFSTTVLQSRVRESNATQYVLHRVERYTILYHLTAIYTLEENVLEAALATIETEILYFAPIYPEKCGWACGAFDFSISK